MQPDLLSAQIEAFRSSFAVYGDAGVTLAPQAVECLDALFMSFAVQARALEGGAPEAGGFIDVAADVSRVLDRALPLAKVVADIEAEAAATDAMAAAMARTNARLRALRAAQDAQDHDNKIVHFPVRPRYANRPTPGEVSVATALAILAGAHNDDAGGAA